jgi:hypothetical protein
VDHYHYLSDGHRGYRSKKQKKEMQKKAQSVVKAYPILPIRQLSMIVDRKIRGTLPNTMEDSEIICKLFGLPWFKEMFVAAKTFYAILKKGNPDYLKEWIEKYKNSSVKQIQTLALGISIDINAVIKAIITNIRNGITEGFVNKLKEVKRTMYGRAKLELLKRKMMLGYYYFN